MFMGQIKKAKADGNIERVVVARLFSRNGQMDENPAHLVGEKYCYERETQYKYLLVFIPDKKVPKSDRKPWHYFIYINKMRNTEDIRWYKSLFTVSQDIARWGFGSFEFVDLAGHADIEDALDELRDYLSVRKITLKPVRRFLDDLANRERGYSVSRSEGPSI